jgi:hypothetical protein
MAEVVELEFRKCDDDGFIEWWECGYDKDMSGRYVHESDYNALLERHRRLVDASKAFAKYADSSVCPEEYDTILAALAEEVDDEIS